MSGKSRRSRTKLGRSDIAQDEMGNNRLQGDDQQSVRNQRRAVPNVKDTAGGIIESFEKLDKHVRARRDLGKRKQV